MSAGQAAAPLEPRPAGGTLLALLSAASFGTLPVMFQLAAQGGFERHSLLAQRFLLAGTLLFCGLVLAGRRQPSGRQVATCLALGFFGYATQAFMYFTAVGLGGAGVATVLLYLYPSFVTLLAWAFRGQRPGPARLVALGLATTGSLLTCALGAWRPGAAAVAASLAGALLYAAYLLVSEVALRGVKALAAGTWVCFGAGAAFGLLALAGGRPTLADTPERAGFVAALAVIGTIVPIVTLFAAIARLGAVRVAVISTVEPAVTMALAAGLLGERFGLAQVAGAGLVVSSVLLLHRDRV